MSSPQAVERCPFCKIAAGRDDTVQVVMETRDWVAFFPDTPATPGHTLIIPRAHFSDLWEMPGELAGRLMKGAQAVGRALRIAVEPDGLNLITSAGAAAEQTVYHVHLHVVPRWTDDGFGEIWPPKRPSRRGEIADVAERVRLARRQICSADRRSDQPSGDDEWPIEAG